MWLLVVRGSLQEAVQGDVQVRFGRVGIIAEQKDPGEDSKGMEGSDGKGMLTPDNAFLLPICQFGYQYSAEQTI
jgi:hypothetical protein